MPSKETLWVVPVLIIGLLLAMSLTIFLSPAIGLPLLALAAFIGAIGWFRRSSSKTGEMEDFRDQSPTAEGVEFTGRDRETLTPTERH